MWQKDCNIQQRESKLIQEPRKKKKEKELIALSFFEDILLNSADSFKN